MDIREQLEILKQQLQKQVETETPERKAARERAIKKLMEAMGEFDVLSQKMGTTPEQVAAISQLQNIVLSLGEIKGPEK